MSKAETSRATTDFEERLENVAKIQLQTLALVRSLVQEVKDLHDEVGLLQKDAILFKDAEHRFRAKVP